MITAREAAIYLLTKDKKGLYFPKKRDLRNKRKMAIGQLRMNSLLHIAQFSCMGMNGVPLFFDDMYAGAKCAVIPDIMENFPEIVRERPMKLKEHDMEQRILDLVYHTWCPCSQKDIFMIAQADQVWQHTEKGHLLDKQEEIIFCIRGLYFDLIRTKVSIMC